MDDSSDSDVTLVGRGGAPSPTLTITPSNQQSPRESLTSISSDEDGWTGAVTSHPVLYQRKNLETPELLNEACSYLGELNAPLDFCLGCEEQIVVADTNNHRIQVFDGSGNFEHTFGESGKEAGQLWYPYKVIAIKDNTRYVICDRRNKCSRMQIFTKLGNFLKEIDISYISKLVGLTATSQDVIVALDSDKKSVCLMDDIGQELNAFQCNYLTEPSGIAVVNDEYYVCDYKAHCVVVLDYNGNHLSTITTDPTIRYPSFICPSGVGNLLIGGCYDNALHVACLNNEGLLFGKYVLASNTMGGFCALKLTAKGCLITLSHENHQLQILRGTCFEL